MTSFLAFFEPRDDGWHVTRDVLIERLAQDWPEARLVPSDEMGRTEMRDVGWSYGHGDESIEGWSAQNGTGITLDGNEELAARFAAWFRGLVPSGVDVTFCDDMYTFDFIIPPGAAGGDILRIYSELD